MRFVTWLLSTAAAVAMASWLLDDIWLDGPTMGMDEIRGKIVPLLLVSLILGAVTVFVEPVVKFLSLPFIVLTIGLFLLVINALMLMLTAWIADQLDIGFHVKGFWAALLGSIVITVVNGFIDIAVLEDD